MGSHSILIYVSDLPTESAGDGSSESRLSEKPAGTTTSVLLTSWYGASPSLQSFVTGV